MIPLPTTLLRGLVAIAPLVLLILIIAPVCVLAIALPEDRREYARGLLRQVLELARILLR